MRDEPAAVLRTKAHVQPSNRVKSAVPVYLTGTLPRRCSRRNGRLERRVRKRGTIRQENSAVGTSGRVEVCGDASELLDAVTLQNYSTRTYATRPALFRFDRSGFFALMPVSCVETAKCVGCFERPEEMTPSGRPRACPGGPRLNARTKAVRGLSHVLRVFQSPPTGPAPWRPWRGPNRRPARTADQGAPPPRAPPSTDRPVALAPPPPATASVRTASA